MLCPGPVKSNIHEVSKNRPPQFGVGDAFRQAEQPGATDVPFPNLMEPAAVGALVLKAVLNDELYVITHGEWRPMAEARNSAVIKAMPTTLDPALLVMLQATAQSSSDTGTGN